MMLYNSQTQCHMILHVYAVKVSKYDKEIPKSHTAEETNTRHREEEPPNTNSHNTSGRQLK